ncbi:MAG: hypothetical protein M1838_005252 [Thelocarpon superellum]|nr:MAG: hypothetical protein M1838_005252 [Thelocarpon superellum]
MNYYLSTAITVGYYVVYPITTLISWLLVCLAPVLHLAHYTFHALLLPLRILAKFETLYIYLGVAAVVGILTGSILHFSSGLLIWALDLRSSTEEDLGPHVERSRAALRKKKSGPAGSLSPIGSGSRPVLDPSIKREYADWLDRDRARKRDGLLSQTILEEEDDDSDYDF